MNKKTYLKVVLALMLALTMLFASTQVLAATVSNAKGLTAKMENGKAYLSWEAAQNATGYEVYVKLPGSGYICIGSTAGTNATVVGLTRGSSYMAKIRAYQIVNGNRFYSEGYSNEKELKVADSGTNELDSIRNLNVTIEEKSAKVTWGKVTNATGYEVHVNIPGRGYMYIGSVGGNGVIINGFEENVEYPTRIRAFRMENGQKVQYSQYAETTILIKNGEDLVVPDTNLGQVTGLKVNVSGDKAVLSWNKVDNATSYKIHVMNENGAESYIDVAETSKTFAIGESTYSAEVMAVRTVDGITISEGKYSDKVTFKKEVQSTPEPTVIRPGRVNDVIVGDLTHATTEGVVLKWQPLTSKDGYQIMYEIKLYEDNFYKRTYTSSGSSLLLTGLSAGKYYRATVQAYKIVNGSKLYSLDTNINSCGFPVAEAVTKPGKVTGLRRTGTGENNNFMWNKVNGADGYRLYITGATNTEFYTTSTSRNVMGYTDMYIYNATVSAYKVDSKGNKIYGEETTIQFVPQPKVKNLTYTSKDGSHETGDITLRWNKIQGADGYEVSFIYGGLGEVGPWDTKTNSITRNGFSKDVWHKARVRAYRMVDGKKVYGEYSDYTEIYLNAVG